MKEFLIVVNNEGKADLSSLDQFFSNYKNKLFYCRVSLKKQKRTLSQNNYFHLICKGFADYTGNDLYFIKSFFKLKFLNFGEKNGIPLVKNTSDLTVLEFKEFLEKVIAFCVENGYNPPNPEDLGYEKIIWEKD